MTFFELSSRSSFLAEHDLSPKTGTHPGSSPGQAFSGSCSAGKEKPRRGGVSGSGTKRAQRVEELVPDLQRRMAAVVPPRPKESCRPILTAVIAGLDTASPACPTCGAYDCETRASQSFDAIHQSS